MILTVYADSTGLFTKEEAFVASLCNIEVPEECLMAYYEAHMKEFEEECIKEGYEPSFNSWYYDVYTADDVEEFFEFAAEKFDYHPVLAE